MVRSTGDRKKALAALARRLAIILWRISVTGAPYRPRPCEKPTAGPSNPNKKRDQPELAVAKRNKRRKAVATTSTADTYV